MKYNRKKYAFAWRNGRVQFGVNVPDGAICISEGDCSEWRKAIETLCRLSYCGKYWLVPGVPEAESDIEAVDALVAFKQIVRRIERKFEDAARAAKKRELEAVT
jgi:hypothetical protein